MPKQLKSPSGTLKEEYGRLYATNHAAPPGALVKQDDGTMQWNGITLKPTSATFPEKMDAETWQQFGELIGGMSQSIAWWVGDWCVYGADRKYGELAELARALGYDESTTRQYAWVARSIEPSRRLDGLSFNHHMNVASIDDPELQDHYLQQALENDWSTRAMREAISGHQPDAFDKLWRRVNSISRFAVHLSQPERQRIAKELRKAADEIEHPA